MTPAKNLPGFVKLPRSLLGEDWASNPKWLALFVRLLLMANREAKECDGIQVQRGQVITSLSALQNASGLTRNEVRAALDGLQRAGATRKTTHGPTHGRKGNATRDTTHGYTIVTICDFDNYEGVKEDGHTRNHTRSEAETTRETTRETTPTKEKKEKYIITTIVRDERFLSIVADWIEYKRERGEDYKGPQGVKSFYNRLLSLSNNDPAAARRIVEASITAGYKGIFPEKETRPGKSTTRPGNNPLTVNSDPSLYHTTYKL
jgi:hypothetical protein